MAKPTLAVMNGFPSLDAEGETWRDTVDAVVKESPDLLLMNEMPFGRWIAHQRQPDPVVLRESHRAHEAGNAGLAELGVPTVLSTRPCLVGGRSVNQAFVWTQRGGIAPLHTKQYFPDEEGFYEAHWWRPGRQRFDLGTAGALRIGFLICTDVQFLEHARAYGRAGAHLIAVPRAVTATTLDRWKTVMAAAAITSGCYVASSNRVGVDEVTGMEFGGGSWIFGPDGTVLAETTMERRVVCATIDTEVAEGAKKEYPNYVVEPAP